MDTNLPQNIGEYWALVKRRKKLFLIPSLCTALVLVAAYPFIPRTYRASALIMVSDQEIIPSDHHKSRRNGSDVEKKIRSMYVELMEPSTMKQLAEIMNVPESIKNDEWRLKRWVNRFRRHMEITEQPDGVVEMAFISGDPRDAQISANAITRLMQEIDQKIRQQQAEKTIKFVEQQLGIYKEKIQNSEKSFFANKVSSDLELALRQRTVLLNQIEQYEKSSPSLAQGDNPTVFKLKTELSETRSRLTQMSLTARDGSPMIRELKQRINELEAAIAKERDSSASEIIPGALAGSPYAQLLAQLRDVNATISSLQRKQTGLEKGTAFLTEEDISAKLREQNVNEDIYQNLLQSLESAQMQLRLAMFGENGQIRILEEADRPSQPIWPQPVQALGIGVFLSLAVGVAFVFFREVLDSSLRGVEDAQRSFKQPILATIPDLYPVKSKLVNNLSDPSPQMVSLNNPQSLPAEHYRLMRTRILFVTQNRPFQVLMFSSAVAGEGKTTTSCNMAISMANELDKNIVLLDCDLRQSSVGQYLGIPQGNGLRDYLQGDSNLDDILKPTRLDRLSVITGGNPVANPSKLLASPKFAELIKELRSRFDYVIIDSAPVVPLADVPIIVSEVDAIAIVVQVGKTPKKFVRQALASIGNAQRAPLLGLVLTRVENTLPTYVNQYFVSGAGLKS